MKYSPIYIKIIFILFHMTLEFCSTYKCSIKSVLKKDTLTSRFGNSEVTRNRLTTRE